MKITAEDIADIEVAYTVKFLPYADDTVETMTVHARPKKNAIERAFATFNDYDLEEGETYPVYEVVSVELAKIFAKISM